MRNMHIYQNKGQMQWILGKIYNLNYIKIQISIKKYIPWVERA